MKLFSKVSCFYLSVFLFLILLSCSDNNSQKVLRLGVIPFESSEDLLTKLAPMVDVISKGLNIEVKPFLANDYTGVIEAFRGKKLDVAFLSAASYVMANREAGVKVVLKSQREGSPYYYSALITRKDSNINTINDLKGKKMAFGDPLSTSGYIFPKKLLLEHKINPDTDFSNVIYAGTHDAIVLSLINKKVDAAATFSEDKYGKKGSWTKYLKPEEVDQIKVIAMTEPIPSDNICVSQDLDKVTSDKLVDVLLKYSQTTEGKNLMRKLYKFDGYVKAEDADYDVIRKAFEVAGVSIKDTLKKK